MDCFECKLKIVGISRDLYRALRNTLGEGYPDASGYVNGAEECLAHIEILLENRKSNAYIEEEVLYQHSLLVRQLEEIPEGEYDSDFLRGYSDALEDYLVLTKDDGEDL